MGMMAKKGGVDLPGENVAWVAISDMMLGMFIVFLTLFIVALTGFSDSAAAEKSTQIQIISDLAKELELKNLDNVEVDKLTGDLKIADLELFDTGSAVLSPRGKAFLDELIPIYVNTVFSNPEMIDKVESFIVQGHTDSTGSGTKDQIFLKNMELSTRRAQSVAEYILHTGYDKKHQEKLLSMMVVEGKSHTDPILNKDTGLEDKAKSRRVELRLKTKNTNIMDLILGVAG